MSRFTRHAVFMSLWLSGCFASDPLPATQASPREATLPAAKTADPPAPATAPESAADAPPAEAEHEPITDPPGAELARSFAARLQAGSKAAPSIPSPRDPGDNNLGSLVRPAGELASELPPFAVSYDKTSLAFIRREQGQSSIWLAAADGSHARPVLDIASAQLQLPSEGGSIDAPAGAIFDLAFSPDGTRIFFQTDGWATSFALYAFEFATGKARFVVDANGYFVISACKRQPKLDGLVVAYRHSYGTLLASAFDAYFLVDLQGRDLGAIGEQPENVERFLSKACSHGPGTPIPAPPKIDGRLKRLPSCGAPDHVLRYAPVHFLDGTELPVFYIVERSRAHMAKLTLDDVQSPPIPLDALAGGLESFCNQM